MGSNKILSQYQEGKKSGYSNNQIKIKSSSNHPMSEIHSPFSGFLQGFGSPALPSVAHSFSSGIQLDPLYCCCCSWWPFHGPAISKTLGSSAAIGLHFYQQPLIDSLHDAKSQLLCMTPLVLGHQLQLHLHQWSSMASHSAKSQLLSMTLSCIQNQYHLGDSYTLSSPAASMKCNLGHLWNAASLCSQKTVPRRFHLSDAGLFLITTNFLAPAN